MNKLSEVQMDEKHLNIVRGIISKRSYHFYAYGSRVKKTAWKFSDFDICYKEEIPLKVISEIREEFIESNLPFEIDLVNWKYMRVKFREMIEEDLILL